VSPSATAAVIAARIKAGQRRNIASCIGAVRSRHHILQVLAGDRIGVIGAIDFLTPKLGIGAFNGIEANWTEAFEHTLDVRRTDR
jgi:hypothetical protein